ncbi:hypothetical protein FOA43_002176 [Brettanomyces nanus]|uniref:Periodic tryptophan protein 1 n=1 Tax=Eeniella nana TaxID=13502 RepID=A0A875RPB6_EENNA|nr:uncharacterized protein FOA43_002176 [Brettanomyces nanus]QPG74840.1 hypothetical protein FOA43_002176 [Brettanomyces nanus]
MNSATTWVPRGVASEFPEKYILDDEEMARINAMAHLHLGEAHEDLSEAQSEEESPKNDAGAGSNLSSKADKDDDLKEYDLDHYDDEPEDVTGEPITMFPGLTNTEATYFRSAKKPEEGEDGEKAQEPGDDDHYLQLPTEEDRLEEKKDQQVYPTDNMILSTRTEDDISYLDVYIYDDGAGAPDGSKEEDEDKLDPDVANGMIRGKSLYIHHDLMLPNFPLCVEWLSFRPMGSNDESNVGNFAAIGTLDPTVEIWNLDCLDKAFPDTILGEATEEEAAHQGGKKRKGKKYQQKHVKDRHVDAILSISHNKVFRNVLATTSADTTVKLWDLTSCGVARSIDGLHHDKEVSSSQWFGNDSETDGSILLTGGYDSYCAVSDVRINELEKMARYYQVGSSGEEVEAVSWAGKNSSCFYAGTDQGNVYYFDARNEKKPVWTLHAHDSGITALNSNGYIDTMLVTGAMGDKQLKLWKTTPTPSMVTSRDFGCGNVLTSSFAPDIEVAGDLVVGGSSPGLKMWDCFSNRYVRVSFKDELRKLQKSAREEAKKAGIASRLARKYGDVFREEVLEPEDEVEEEEE